MHVITLTSGVWSTNAYLVSDGTSSDALLLDPVEDGEQYLAETEKHGLRIIAIVATHSHVDHVGGVAGAKARLGAQVPFMIGEGALQSLRDERRRAAVEHSLHMPAPPSPDRLLREGETIQIGSLCLDALDTPGHWHGDIALYERRHNAVFAGDTLGRGFIFQVNKGCDVPTLLRSIKTKLLALPDTTRIYPGHGPDTTVGKERASNPALRE